MILRSRGEEGQVYPALLLAIVGGFAIAVSFLGLQNLLDQTGRADTASDSAALAAAKEHKREFIFLGGLDVEPTTKMSLFLTRLTSMGQGTLSMPRAQGFAQSNGAAVINVRYYPFNFLQRQWKYTITTKQDDTVEGGDATARSESSASAVLKVTDGLCVGAGPGVEIGGTCMDLVSWTTSCGPLVQTKPPYCFFNLADQLTYEIRLVA